MSTLLVSSSTNRRKHNTVAAVTIDIDMKKARIYGQRGNRCAHVLREIIYNVQD